MSCEPDYFSNLTLIEKIYIFVFYQAFRNSSDGKNDVFTSFLRLLGIMKLPVSLRGNLKKEKTVDLSFSSVLVENRQP